MEPQTISGTSIYNQTSDTVTLITRNSPTVEAGAVGQAMKFVSASNQYASGGDGAAYGVKPYTTILIAKSPHDAMSQYAIQQMCSIASNGCLFSWDHTNGAFGQAWALQAGGSWFSAKYVTSLRANTYYTLIVTFDGTYLKAYLGDSLESTTQVTATPGYMNRVVYLGCGWGANPCDCSIAEFRFYTRVLSAGEISAIARLRG
jgi:hypothetical protein